MTEQPAATTRSAPATSQTRGPLRTVQGPVAAAFMSRLINPAMRRVLGGRFHRAAGSSTLMVLSFAGRRSGKAYSFPIGYLEVDGGLVCYTPFRWWTNLQGGAPVTVTLRGRRIEGTADTCADTGVVTEGMAVYLRHNPGDARFWKVRLDAAKQPDLEDVARAARENVQVRIALQDA